MVVPHYTYLVLKMQVWPVYSLYKGT
jgi:hypothetical protein